MLVEFRPPRAIVWIVPSDPKISEIQQAVDWVRRVASDRRELGQVEVAHEVSFSDRQIRFDINGHTGFNVSFGDAMVYPEDDDTLYPHVMDYNRFNRLYKMVDLFD
jgi:hypothetical protein